MNEKEQIRQQDRIELQNINAAVGSGISNYSSENVVKFMKIMEKQNA